MEPPADLVITLEQTAAGGRWVAHTAAGPASELTFQIRSDGALVADHTLVPPELEGRGIAAALVARAVADARGHGLRIEPRCSYVVAAFQRHPEYRDVLAPARPH
jgi:predicted GNAT family acetyltransferase